MKENTSILEGAFVKRAFVSKRGTPSDSIFELYLSVGFHEYFIKFCESEVKRDEVIAHVGEKVKATVVLTKGLWDICDSHSVAQSRGGEYVQLVSFSAPDNPSLRYSDGNGNTYVLTTTSIRYVPVKPQYSSSGAYDGGEPKEKGISAGQFDAAVAEFERLHGLTGVHTHNREMGTGVLTRINGEEEWTVIVKMGSEKDGLEAMLRGMIK